jgi:hypothetical protein
MQHPSSFRSSRIEREVEAILAAAAKREAERQRVAEIRIQIYRALTSGRRSS